VKPWKRKLGEMLKATEREKAGRPKLIGSEKNRLISVPTLSQLKIDKRTSVQAQKIAGLSQEKFDKAEGRRAGKRGEAFEKRPR